MRTTITANHAALRYQDGVEYLVCPVAMIRPGVLSANNGAIYYRETLLRDRPARWNRVPLTLGHPADASGRRISANSADARRHIIGHVDSVRYVGGTLRGEAWFDVERTPARLLRKIEAGRTLEVSTGLYTQTVNVTGVYAGRRYEKRLTGFTPDHLAVLEHETGACSVADGCGLAANAAGRALAGFQPTWGAAPVAVRDVDSTCGCGCGGACRGVDIPPHREVPLADPWDAPTGSTTAY